MANKKASAILTLVSSHGLLRETACQREERELLSRRGVGVGLVSEKFQEGMRLCLEMLQEGENVEDPKASLDRQFRDCPQVNFALPFLKHLKEHGDSDFQDGFAAVLSDCIQTALQYNDSRYIEDLVDGTEVANG